MKGEMGDEQSVRQELDGEDRIGNDPQCREVVDAVFKEISSYRRRNEWLWGWEFDMNWRRRSSRKRRVRLQRRREGASEREGRGDKGRGDDVRDRSKFRRRGGWDIGLHNQSRQDTFRIGQHFEE
jgi:hypothetical protein